MIPFWQTFCQWRSRVHGRRAVGAMDRGRYLAAGTEVYWAELWRNRSVPRAEAEAMSRALAHPADPLPSENRGHDAHFTTAYADGARDAEDRPDNVTADCSYPDCLCLYGDRSMCPRMAPPESLGKCVTIPVG